MRTGSETLETIEDALRDVKGEESRVRESLEEALRERSDLMTRRLDAFKELARVRTKHAVADGVIDQADRLSEQVAGILDARQKTIASLQARVDDAESERADLLLEHGTLLASIESLEDSLDSLAEQARKDLSGNKDFETALAALNRARAVHERAGTKAEAAEAARKTKGAAFEGDPLFLYLWKRDFGSKSYEASGIIAWLDEKVAHLVGYHDARANYAVLNEIPVRLREHVARLGKALEVAESNVGDIEALHIRKLAGADLPAELAAARIAQKTLHTKLERVAGELSETVSQVNSYAEGRDRSFRQASELTAGFLEQESLEQLTALARDTTEPSDDQIVARIRNMELRLEQSRGSAMELQKQLERLFRRKEDLIRLSADFRNSYYDDPGSVFTSSRDTDQLLGLLLRGAITVAEYWLRAQRGHSWRARPADPFRRSSGLPPLGGGFNWTLGGRSGGSSSSSSGKDFRTGGGF